MGDPEQIFCYRLCENYAKHGWPHQFLVCYRTAADDEAGYNPCSQVAGLQFVQAAEAWCRDQFGTEQTRWSRQNTSYIIAIRDEVDAAAFRMRWG